MQSEFALFSDDRLLELGAAIEHKREEAIAQSKSPAVIRILARKAEEYKAEIDRRCNY